MHLRSDAVPDVLLHDSVPAGPSNALLDAMPNVGQVATHPCLRQPGPQRRLSHFGQSRDVFGGIRHHNRYRGIAVPAFDDRTAVDRDDVSGLDHPLPWNSMDNFVINRRTNHGRKSVVPEER